MNIRSIYLDLIKEGIKTHEYRLATKERRTIQIGDTIEFKDELGRTLKVKVSGSTLYPNWESALKDRYEKDFERVYASLQETLDTVSAFYGPKQVEEHGIIVFDIKL